MRRVLAGSPVSARMRRAQRCTKQGLYASQEQRIGGRRGRFIAMRQNELDKAVGNAEDFRTFGAHAHLERPRVEHVARAARDCRGCAPLRAAATGGHRGRWAALRRRR
eukprot:593652-Pleurochrysis_carterae.AAC.2